ncbi:uncharacterized protein LOC135502500 [Lineus longissimus]|uniref:uncharacterized protein LOC135502500 n=1 Tax=Lineus longissimus TaxID=88925 RepID=UPI002B4F9FBA
MRSLLFLALCAIVLVVGAAAGEQRQCPEGFMPSLMDCYKAEKTPMTFDDAEDKCLSYNGLNETRFHLLSVQSVRNQTHILRKLELGAKPVWMGILRIKGNPYQWTAEEGMASDSAPWDTTGASKAYCVTVVNGKWKKTKCKTPNIFICSGKQSQYIRKAEIERWEYKDVGCPRTFAAQKGHCYRFFSSKKSWGDAEARCQAVRDGYHLMSVPSTRENILMKAMFPDQIKKNRVWLGLRKVNGVDQWTDHSKYKKSRRNWDRRSKSRAKNCTSLSKTSRGLPKWERVKCSEPHEFICKGGTKASVAITFAPTTTTTTQAPVNNYGGGGGNGYGGGGGGGGGGGASGGMPAFKIPKKGNCKFSLSQRGPNAIPVFIYIAMLQFVPGSQPSICLKACAGAKGRCQSVTAIPRGTGNYLCAIGMREMPHHQKMPWTQCQGCAYFGKRCSGSCRMVPMRVPVLYYQPKTLNQVPGPNMQQCVMLCQKEVKCSFSASLVQGQQKVCLLMGVKSPLPQPRAVKIQGKGGQPLPLRFAHKVCS